MLPSCFVFSQLIMKHQVKMYLSIFVLEFKVFRPNVVGEILNQAQQILQAIYRIFI